MGFGFVLCLLCLCARLFICALWSPAGKGLTSWLSFVVYNCEFVTFPFVSWVRCGIWLYRFLIFAPLLTFILALFTQLAHKVTKFARYISKQSTATIVGAKIIQLYSSIKRSLPDASKWMNWRKNQMTFRILYKEIIRLFYFYFISTLNKSKTRTHSMARHRKSPRSRRYLMVFDPLTPSQGHQFDPRVKFFSASWSTAHPF